MISAVFLMGGVGGYCAIGTSAGVSLRVTGVPSAASPRFTRAEAEAAATKVVQGLTREEARLTTWGGFWAWVDTYIGQQGMPNGPPTSGQTVWAVAVSGSVCCFFDDSFEHAPWAVLVYDATTGGPDGSYLGGLSSGETWPPGFDSIKDLAG